MNQATRKKIAILTAVACLTAVLGGCSVGPSEIAPPDNLQVEVDGLHGVRAKWDPVEEATEYIVTLQKADIKTGEDTAEESASQSADSDQKTEEADSKELTQTVEQTEAVFANLEADTVYEISVQSVYRDDSRELVSKSVAAGPVQTSAPSVGEAAGLTASAASDSEITVTWNAYALDAENADGSPPRVSYTLYTAETEDGEYTPLLEQAAQTSYAHTELPEQTTRFYKVAVSVTVDGKTFSGPQTAAVSATTDKAPEPFQPDPDPVLPTPEPDPPASSPGDTQGKTGDGTANVAPSGNAVQSVRSEQDRQAEEVARQIAASIGPGTDLERVSQAAQIVSSYYYQGVHKESGDNYDRPYGVFIAGEASCAGCTRALGLVLEYMGYQWEHVNENQWTHQWCKLEMDGQIGYADGQVGWAGYGEHPVAGLQ